MDKAVVEVSKSLMSAALSERSEARLLKMIKELHPNCDLKVIRRAALYAVTDLDFKSEKAIVTIYSLARNLGAAIRIGDI